MERRKVSMDEGGKQLGALIIAVVVAIALIALGKNLFKTGGTFDSNVTNSLGALTSEVPSGD